MVSPKLETVPPGDPRDRGGKAQPLLIVKGLAKHFPIRGGILNRIIAHVRAVDDVSFVILKGETLGGFAPPLTFTQGKAHTVPYFFDMAIKDGKWAAPEGGVPQQDTIATPS